MTSQDSVQSAFLDQVRKNLPPNISFADELSEILSVSRDSAYRRIRGETVLSLEEVKKLCDHFKVSLDALLAPSSQVVTFQLRALDAQNFSFEKWLRSILGNLDMISGFEQKELFYNAKDCPIFHFFQYPGLAAFKMFFWMKSFSRDSKFGSGKYHPDLINKGLIDLGERMWEKYAAIPSTELVSYEIMNITLRHIQFALDCGMFADKKIAYDLCDDCSRLITHLKSQAEQGLKRTFGKDTNPASRLDLFHNEVLIGDNSILFKMGDKRVSYVLTNNFDILTTSHEVYCHLTEDHLNSLINKSTPISNTAERERNKFFNKIEENIDQVRSAIH